MNAGSKEGAWSAARVWAWGRWALIAFLVYLGLAGWVFPRVLRSQVERRLAVASGTTVRLESVRFDPLAWRLSLRGFSMSDASGHVLFACSNVVVDGQVSSLWRGEAHAREVRVEFPRLQVRRDSTGRVAWLDALSRLGGGPSSNAVAPSQDRSSHTRRLPACSLDSFVLSGGEVVVEDEVPAEPFRAAFSPVNLAIEHLATRPGQEAPLQFSARGDGGERVEWSGRLGLDPLSLKGTLTAERLPVARPRPYTDEHSTKRPSAGWASASMPHELAWKDGVFTARLLDARLAVEGLEVVEKADGSRFFDLRELVVDGLGLEWPERRVSVRNVRVEAPQVQALRMQGKPGEAAEVNWRQLIDPATVAEWVEFSAGWRLQVGEFACDGAVVQFEDRTLDPALRVGVDAGQVRLTGLSNATNAAPARVQAALRWNGQGEARLEGSFGVRPVAAEFHADWRDLRLAVLAPYLQQQVRLVLQRGSISGEADLHYGHALREQQGSLVQAEGRIVLDDFAALESGSGTDFIRWNQVEIAGISASLDPHRVRVTNLVARGLQTSLVVTTNGQLNVLQLLRETRELTVSTDGVNGVDSTPGAAAAASPGRSVTPPIPVQPAPPPAILDWEMIVDRVQLESVALFATDRFYGGGFHTTVESLEGEFRDLRWPQPSPVQVALKGRLSAVSDFTLAGWLKPDPADFGADLKLSTRRADLTQFAPYTIRFVGYPVKQGELTAEVHYRVAGDTLTAENKLLLDQFTLGPRTPSPDAIQLPVKLGVALLKDHEGKIQLDLPLTGTLSDPQFKLAPLIWQAVRNVVLKAAAAPFRLLGALLGGGGEDELEFVEFEPGTSHLSAHQERRIHGLLKALASRPALELEIVPGFDPKDDAVALARQRLEQRLRALRAEALTAVVADPVASVPEVLGALSPEDRARFLKLAYVREFGAVSEPAAAALRVPIDGAAPAPAPTQDAATEAAAVAALTLDDAELERRLIGLHPVAPAELTALAEARREVVRTQLLAGGLAPERLLLPGTNAPPDRVNEKARVTFRLE